MNGLGGLNKSPDGVVVGVVQLQLPTVVTMEDLSRQTDKICGMVSKAKAGMPTLDLVVVSGIRPPWPFHGHERGNHVPPRGAGGRRLQASLRRQ